MDSHFSYVIYGLLCFLPILLFLYYRKERKKLEGFPFYHGLPRVLYDIVMGKKPKDVSFNNYMYKIALDIAKHYTKEGLLMIYVFRPVLFVFGEEEVKFFLNEKAALDKAPEYDYLTDFIGAGILTSNGERWKKHRKMINPIFHVGMLKDKVSHFNEHAAALVKDLEKFVGKPSVDLLYVLKCNCYNALSESIFGLKQDEENKEKTLRYFTLVDSLNAMVARRMFHPWLRPQFLLKFSSVGRKYLKEHEEYKNFITKIINDMKQHVVSNETADTHRFSSHLQKSFAYMLLMEHLSNPSFTFQDLHDEICTMFNAGYDTITFSTLWCLFLLALHPEIQENALNEINSVVDNYITYEDTCNLTYLEAVIMETLRLYPTVPLYGRVLSEDVQYGKYKVHKGTSVGFVPCISSMNPDIYPNPETFDPERFLNKDSKKSWSFVPYSKGSRSCIGKRYSIIEMKVFLSYILRNFKIRSLDRREDVPLSWTVFLTPARPIRMEITPRQTEE